MNIGIINNNLVEGEGMAENLHCLSQNSIEEAGHESTIPSEPIIIVLPMQAASRTQYIPTNSNLEVNAFR